MHWSIVDNIFDIFQKKNPNPISELFYINYYTLLVAVMLSAQSTDKQVNIATKKLFLNVSNPFDMVKIGEFALKQHIRNIGLFNSKAHNIITMSKLLIKEHNSVVPCSITELIKLPGVGKKTASVVVNAAFKIPVIAVDTHVFRVSNRIGLIEASSVDTAYKIINEVVPKKWKINAHNWLVLHGRYICKKHNPSCNICPIKEFCNFYNTH